MINKDQMLYEIMMLDFAVTDATLFLDTHPEDKDAYRYCKEANERLKKAQEQYVKEYGPLTNRCSTPDSYSYIQGPWPWEVKR